VKSSIFLENLVFHETTTLFFTNGSIFPSHSEEMRIFFPHRTQ
jgi:hypothetical protein